MKYSKNELYEYVRIAKAVVSEEKKDEEACIDSLTQFILNMKVRIKFLFDQFVKYTDILSRILWMRLRA